MRKEEKGGKALKGIGEETKEDKIGIDYIRSRHRDKIE